MSHLVTGSGYLNSPVRTLLIADDNRPGSYPVQISPQTAAKSGQFTKPYRDNVVPDTPVVYARAKVTFNGIPGSSETITLTNAASVASTFTFRTNNVDLVAGPNSYNVNLYALNRAVTQYDTGLSINQVLIKRAAERFITAVNSATGSLITASPTDKFNVVMLTQKIPGTAGNTTNTYVTDGEFVVENFTGGNSGEVRYPYGISVGSVSELLQRVHSTEVTGTLSVPTSGKAGLLSAYSDQHPYGVFQPYDESNAVQSFGAAGGSRHYGTQTGLSDEFFTRGSISGSLDEPLWVKDKIEIDLTPVVDTTLLANDGLKSSANRFNYPMGYYNFDLKKWDPIGFGNGQDTVGLPNTLQDRILNPQYVGFSQGWGNRFTYINPGDPPIAIFDPQIATSYTGQKAVFMDAGWMSPIDTFGFPLHPKYHATGSQQLSVDRIIDRPFLVEKIVYEFSASMPSLSSELGAAPNYDEYTGGGAVFFILNQRKANPDPGQELSYTNVYVSETSGGSGREFLTPLEASASNGPLGDHYVVRYDNGGIPRTMQLSPSGPSVYVDTIRDLVTFARVGTVWDTYSQEIENTIEEGFTHPALFMDLAITVPAAGTFSGSYTLAAPVRAPSQNTAVANIDFSPSTTPNSITSIYASKDSSTRNSINVSTGRSYNSEFIGPKYSYKVRGAGLSNSYVFSPKTDSTPSPYLICPGDKLIFGWQSPLYNDIGDNDVAKTFKIHPGKGKLILYGSYLRDDKPVHDIYKDQLNSDAVHEAIPAGPWVLDRFESEPTMVYSSSMREEHVTGTMVTRGADGKLIVTDVNDLGIGGVRAVSARASDGNLGFRYSFFRDTRLVDSEEQYYDSMQLNPIDMLLNYSGSTSYALQSSIDLTKANIFISVPDEYYGGLLQKISTGSNRSFIGSFAYETPKYENIDRVKKINSQVISGEKFKGLTIAGNFESSLSLASISFYAGSGPANLPDGTTRPFSLFRRTGGLSNSNIVASVTYRLGPSREYDTNPVDYDLSAVSSVAAPEFDIDGVNYHLSRQLGCFGDGYMGLQQCIKIPPGLSPSILTGSIYRGTRYGLVNPTPLFSSAVFSGTRYGQFRDMMEPRQYTRFSLNNSTLTDAAVSVQFVDRSAAPGTYAVVSGSFTNSTNVSPFATSEHPYDDALSDYGQIWDRQTPLPETLISL